MLPAFSIFVDGQRTEHIVGLESCHVLSEHLHHLQAAAFNSMQDQEGVPLTQLALTIFLGTEQPILEVQAPAIQWGHFMSEAPSFSGQWGGGGAHCYMRGGRLDRHKSYFRLYAGTTAQTQGSYRDALASLTTVSGRSTASASSTPSSASISCTNLDVLDASPPTKKPRAWYRRSSNYLLRFVSPPPQPATTTTTTHLALAPGVPCYTCCKSCVSLCWNDKVGAGDRLPAPRLHLIETVSCRFGKRKQGIRPVDLAAS